MSRILVIAGTVDARLIIEDLVNMGLNVTATVATQLGGTFLKQYEGVEVLEGRLTAQEMVEVIKNTVPKCLVDASHPFAKEVSANAMGASKSMCIPYLRYEREKTALESDNVICVKDFEAAVERLKVFKDNIFLTIGSNNLEIFTRVAEFKKRIFARVLPDSKVLGKCEGLGLDAGNIIAMKGPFSESMNIEVLKYCDACVMVTKDSGSAGGNDEKIRAAKKLGIPVIMVERPQIDYGSKVSKVEDVLVFVQRIIGRGSEL